MHRLTDRVWRVTQEKRSRREEFLFHLEFESSAKPNVGQRVGMYGWGLCGKEKLPVSSVVWYVGEQHPSDWPENTWKRGQQQEMVVGGKVVSWVSWWEVWLPGGYLAKEFVEEAPVYLLPFAAMMPDMNKPLLLQLKEKIMNSAAEAGQKQDLLAILVFFACRMFSPKEVMEEIQMDIFTNNPLIAYLEQKNRQEGRQEGQIGLLQSLARKLFPHTSEATIRLIGELNREALEELGEAILDVADGRAFRHLLLQLKQKSISEHPKDPSES